LVKYRTGLFREGELKPGETLLVCGADGGGGLGCITSTYLDRLIAWYVGAEEIEKCLTDKSLSCLDDLALNALRLKVLRKTPCDGNSFVPGTRVLMADRRTKAIEDIRVGDRVLATDPLSGRTEAEAVQATIVGTGSKHLVRIGVTGSGNTRKGAVISTDGHPFWVAGDSNTWKKAADVQTGMRLRTDTGKNVRVASTKAWTTPEQRVYNLTVADIHTFYVLAGTTPVLVHNASQFCGPDLEAVNHWYPSTLKTSEASAKYHIDKHGKGRTLAEYTQEALDLWNKTKPEDRIPWKIMDGTMGWKIKGGLWGGEGIYSKDGRVVTWHD
jgi:hypothetical protein